MKKVLVVAVHPDDETLGCGGTLLKHKASGDSIYWLIATSMTEEVGFEAKKILQRKEEIKTVRKMYGFDAVVELGFPTTTLDRQPLRQLVDKIEKVFKEAKPDIVYLPFMYDVHSDHRIIFNACHSLTKCFRNSYVKKILMMEVLSETEFSPALKEFIFIPNYFVDVIPFLDKKIDIMKIYKGEMPPHPHPRSEENIRALALTRGAMAGTRFAESFMLLREIV